MQKHSIARAVSGARWNPRDGLIGSDQGLWYDPSDLSTLFQDAAGTTPVTAVEQPVGLMLDKSKGLVLGSELVVNGTFDTAENWTRVGVGGTASISGGAASITNVAGSFEAIGFSQSIPVVSGKTYLVTATFTKSSAAGFARVSFGPVSVISSSATSGVLSGYVTSSTSSFTLAAFNPGNGSEAITVTIDNISVRELPGNHAFQTTSTKRPVLSARYNLLTKTERFAQLPWAAYSATIQDNTSDTLDPIGGNNASKAIYGGASAGFYVEATMNTSYKYSIYAKKGTYDVAKVAVAYVTPSPSATFNMTSGVASVVDCTASMTSIENDWWLCTIVFTVSGSARIVNYCGTTTGHNLYYFGASLVPANQASLPYQRVNTSTDYDSDPTKFPWYLKFNGVNQSLQTASIDFTSTDKMLVCAGVRKLSDAAAGILFETSVDVTASYPGSFSMFSPHTASGTTYQPYFRGDVGWAYESLTPFAAPITNVVTAQMFNRLPAAGVGVDARVNGVAQIGAEANSITDAGNFGNYPLYIGARAGTSLFFNGHLYRLVICGRPTTVPIDQITRTEEFVNRKTKAY